MKRINPDDTIKFISILFFVYFIILSVGCIFEFFFYFCSMKKRWCHFISLQEANFFFLFPFLFYFINESVVPFKLAGNERICYLSIFIIYKRSMWKDLVINLFKTSFLEQFPLFFFFFSTTYQILCIFKH